MPSKHGWPESMHLTAMTGAIMAKIATATMSDFWPEHNSFASAWSVEGRTARDGRLRQIMRLDEMKGPTSMSTDEHVLVTRLFRASAERVFDAWLDSRTAGEWLFASPTGQIVCVEIDGRVGGWFYIVDRRDGEDVEHIGEYFEVDRPRRLAFALSVEKYGQSFDRVIIEIVPLASGCMLTLMHHMKTGMAGEAANIEAGWSRVLDRLAATVGERPLLALMREARGA